MRTLVLGLWGLAMGAIVLHVFFTTIGAFDPRDALGVTAVVAVIAVCWFVRSVRIEFELRSRAGDPQLRSEYNRMRERRGF